MSSRGSRVIDSSNLIDLSDVQPIIIAHNQSNNCKGGDKSYKNTETYFINTIAKSLVHFSSWIENDFIISEWKIQFWMTIFLCKKVCDSIDTHCTFQCRTTNKVYKTLVQKIYCIRYILWSKCIQIDNSTLIASNFLFWLISI